MQTFAFLIHPLDIDDIAKKYKIAKRVSPKVVGQVLRRRPPFVVSEIEGIQSKTGVKARGWFVAVPLLPWQFAKLEEEYIIEKLVKACKVAKKEGAKIVGLGAFTAIAGGGGQALSEMVDIPITTGNTYTTTTAIQGTMQAAKEMEVDPAKSTLAVVGATGSIGQACVKVMAADFNRTIIVGRDKGRLNELKAEVTSPGGGIDISTSVEDALGQADVIVTVTGATGSVIKPSSIKSGAIICDVARPRDVSRKVSLERDDVLVIDGSIVKAPGDVNFNFNFGPPPGMCEGCVGETIILALEGRYENYTIGKNITVEKVKEMGTLAKKHGFTLAGLRRHEQLITASEIEKIKSNKRGDRKRSK